MAITIKSNPSEERDDPLVRTNMESNVSINTGHSKSNYNWKSKQPKFDQRASTLTCTTIETFNNPKYLQIYDYLSYSKTELSTKNTCHL
jgi:hypothetical protein